MSEIISFAIGCFVGGFFGVVTMCLLQINRSDDYKTKEDETDEKKL